MEHALISEVEGTVGAFATWLENYGETSYDHQSYFAGRVGRAAKTLYYRQPTIGTLAVAPMIASEAWFPSARRLFWRPMRFPIADAHYASGFAFLASGSTRSKHYDRAVHFLEVLIETRSQGYARYAWGYPFDWVTRTGTIKTGTPFITTLPYVYEAFEQVYRIDRRERWLEVMRSIAEHAYSDYADLETSPRGSSCSYSPGPPDPSRVVNASAYRAFLLTKAACDFNDTRYRAVAERNLNFVLESQNQDGSWFYSMDGQRDFVDHFHTCFVLKALAKIQRITASEACASAIHNGVHYYVTNLIDDAGLPKPFSRAPRLTVYKRELYDYAECLNICLLLCDKFPSLDKTLSTVVGDLLRRWRKPDSSFRSRELLIGWDTVPMHRWGQSQIFRSFCLLLSMPKTIQQVSPHQTARRETA
jgi:hypothetical protein